jgi:hypothetical protein
MSNLCYTIRLGISPGETDGSPEGWLRGNTRNHACGELFRLHFNALQAAKETGL